jgi:hypothetical protein
VRCAETCDRDIIEDLVSARNSTESDPTETEEDDELGKLESL